MVLNAEKLASERAYEIALQDGTRSLTWAALDAEANRVANGLHALVADSGVRRVAMFADNAVEVLVVHLAAINSGVSIVPMSYHLKEDEATFILSDSGASAVFVSQLTAPVAAAAAKRAGIRAVLGWRGVDPSLADSYEDWLSAQSADAPSLDVQSLPNLMYTSGTTGVPKRVVAPAIVYQGGTVREYVGGLGNFHYFMQEHTHLVSGPLYHSAPIIAARLVTVGKPVVVMERFDAERFLELVDRHSVESTMMVPTHFKKLLQLPSDVRERHDISSLKLVVHTGSACPVDVKSDMIAWFGPVFFESYGGTEAGTVCRIGSEEWLAHPGSVGCVQPPYSRVVVVDDQDQELPPGEVGRLFFEDPAGRGIEYGGDLEKTRNAHLRPGVFTLGDVGYVDDDGYVYITDRVTDMVISGGVNIYPAEAEKVLASHPAVADVAVIGIPESTMGEAVHALVVLEAGQQADAVDLIAWCHARLAGFKCPRSVEFVDDLGRTSAGKVNKKQLRLPFWENERTIG